MPRAIAPRVPSVPRIVAGGLARAAVWMRRLGWLADGAAVFVIIAVVLPTVWPLLRAADLDTGAGDWHAHAFRIQEFGARGLASWTHEWAGGLPLWSAYQFVPHVVTWAATALGGGSATRAMAAFAGALCLGLPLVLYGVLRCSGVGVLPALAGALLALALDTRSQALANFSELWGLALTPLLLGAAYRWSGRREGYGVAVACGLAVYVHPLAAVAGTIGLLAGAGPWLPIPHAPPSGVHASVERRGSGSVVRRAAVAIVAWLLGLGLQLLLVAGAAAFFLLPAVWSARPAYEDPYFTSPEFERLLARLTVGSFIRGWPVWFGLGLASALLVALRGRLALPRPLARYVQTRWVLWWGQVRAWVARAVPFAARAWRGRAANGTAPQPTGSAPPNEYRRAAVFVLLVSAAVVVLALTSMAGWGPRLYRNAQLPRLLALLPLLAACAVALFLAWWQATARARANGPALARTVAALIAIIAAGVATGRSGLPRAVSLNDAEPRASFTRWLRSLHEPLPPGSRVSAPPEVVADASAFARGRAWYTGSYSGREWSILAGPLAAYMTGFGAPETRGAFLTALAVDLAVTPTGTRPLILDPATWQPADWQLVAELGDVDVLRLPWRAPYAVAVPRGADAALQTPDLRFRSVEEAYIRDELTRRWAALLRGPAAIPATVRVRPGGAVDFELRDLPPDRVVLVSENWDRSWRATSGGRVLPVRRAGPNLLAIDLADAPTPVHGDVHVRLTHERPREWEVGVLVVALTIPVALAALAWGPRQRG